MAFPDPFQSTSDQSDGKVCGGMLSLLLPIAEWQQWVGKSQPAIQEKDIGDRLQWGDHGWPIRSMRSA